MLKAFAWGVTCFALDLGADILDPGKYVRLEGLYHGDWQQCRVLNMDDHGDGYICILVQGDEKHDGVPCNNAKVHVVNDDIASAFVTHWKASDVLDNISRISRCRKEERIVRFGIDGSLIVLESEDVQRRHVTPKVLLGSKLSQR